MMLRFKELQKENEELSAMLEKSEKDIEDIRKQLEAKQSDYDSLKMSKMIEISDGDIASSKERLSRLIRNVNKCIAILSDDK